MVAFLAPGLIGGRAYLAPGAPPAVLPTADTVLPTFTGTLAYTATSSSITVSWTGTTSADNVAVARREYRIGGTGPYTAATAAEEAAKSHTLTGLDSNSTYQVDVRCVDTSGNVSSPLTIAAKTDAPAAGGGGDNYVRVQLGTRENGLHLNLATVHWALMSQLLPSVFGAPVAKGIKSMTAGSALLEIRVAAAAVPVGWYMLALSDPDGTTTVMSRVQVTR